MARCNPPLTFSTWPASGAIFPNQFRKNATIKEWPTALARATAPTNKVEYDQNSVKQLLSSATLFFSSRANEKSFDCDKCFLMTITPLATVWHAAAAAPCWLSCILGKWLSTCTAFPLTIPAYGQGLPRDRIHEKHYFENTYIVILKHIPDHLI